MYISEDISLRKIYIFTICSFGKDISNVKMQCHPLLLNNIMKRCKLIILQHVYFYALLTYCLGQWYFGTHLFSLLLNITFCFFSSNDTDFTFFLFSGLNLSLQYNSRCIIAFPMEENLCIIFPHIDLCLSLFQYTSLQIFFITAYSMITRHACKTLLL